MRHKDRINLLYQSSLNKILHSVNYAVIATALAYLLYYRVLAMAGSGNLMLCTLMVAPVAIILGAVVLDEALPLRAYAGFGLLTLGLIIIDGRLITRLKRP